MVVAAGALAPAPAPAPAPAAGSPGRRSSTLARRAALSRVAAAAVAAALPADGIALAFDGDDGDALQARVEAALADHFLLETGLVEEEEVAEDAGRGGVLAGCLPLVAEGVADLVDDGFSLCFEEPVVRRWNWGYLAPFYAVGAVLRYCVLFPLRLVIAGVASFVLGVYFLVVRGDRERERRAVAMTYYAQALMLAFGAVVTYHGVRPRRSAGVIYAANHTTMLDYVFMLGLFPFSVVGQAHSGLVGFFQRQVFDCLQCLWFDRGSGRDRAMVRSRILGHVKDPDVPPLCVFPEGTCVNNRYALLFKQGAFELDGVDVVPVAIRYDQSFASGFWDSRKVGFVQYLARLMTQWCLVVDIHFLPREVRREGESPREFAARVKAVIAERAQLVSVPFDGYFKHHPPNERYVKERQKRAVPAILAISR